MMTQKSTRLVAAYLLLTLVCSQFLLAQHNIEHFDVAIQDFGHDDDGRDLCEACVTAKNLGQDCLVQAHVTVSVPKTPLISTDVFTYITQSTCNKPFQSQAPPTLFS